MAINGGTLHGFTLHGRPNLSTIWSHLLAVSPGASNASRAGPSFKEREHEQEDNYVHDYRKPDEVLTVVITLNKTETRFHRIVSYEPDHSISITSINTDVPVIDITNVKVTR